jgi:hypothetical protein
MCDLLMLIWIREVSGNRQGHELTVESRKRYADKFRSRAYKAAFDNIAEHERVGRKYSFNGLKVTVRVMVVGVVLM